MSNSISTEELDRQITQLVDRGRVSNDAKQELEELVAGLSDGDIDAFSAVEVANVHRFC